MLTYLVTGANGFVGSPLCQSLLQQGAIVRGSIRTASAQLPSGVEAYLTGSIHEATDWRSALTGVDCVIHLAATVHRPDIQDPQIYTTTIADATAGLFQQAVVAGVKRFVYISTSHVYGAEGSQNLVNESSLRNPDSAYGRAKMVAEDKILALAVGSAMELVIIRPPLIYGPTVRGNMAQLIHWVRTCPILPLGLANQKRSFVGLDNLLAFILLCTHHPGAAHKIFNVSDDQDLSTQQLCQVLAEVMTKKRYLLPISPKIMHFLLKSLGREAMYGKLFEPMRLDISQAKSILGWQPPFSVEQEFRKTV